MILLIEHFFAAFLVGSLGYLLSGEAYCVPMALIFGWLIDADHLCDFLYYTMRSKRLNLRFVSTGQYFKINNKIIVPFHSWELSVLLFFLGIFIPEYQAPLISASFAHIAHLLQDQWTYHVRLCGYSFVSRMNNGFKYKGFCKHGNG